ncbi:MAG TPA: bacteriohopanetetrol glucosamine biosynthesis glycosyltransferase HpnI [Vicinamibacterales bacterium]|jgi:ceramide glucosyltransferase|nr:bacteriohopanetetrol glucosamine biosynthesis glycosyltransferase HpnI [Vicinamibacterales bacterium]
MSATPISAIVLFVAALPSLYDLFVVFSAYRARRFFRSGHQGVRDWTPPVSILKPVRGLDRSSYDNFATFCRQDYPDYEVVFAVADERDPAIDVVRRLMENHPERSIRLLIGVPELGSSSKVNKLCRLTHEARHDLLVISDSDVRVTPEYLQTVVAPFRDPSVGAVTCLYTGSSEGHLADDLEALGIATDFAAGVLAAWNLEGIRFTLGATMATRRQRLEEIGGFEAVVDYLAEDFQLGHRIAALGYRVELAPYVVSSECAAGDLRSYFQHQLRWAITVRHSRPWGYAGLLLTQGLPWAVAAVLTVRTSAVATAYFGAYLTLRVLMAWTVAKWALGDVGVVKKWWLLPVRDALAFAVWGAGLFVNRVHWRGRDFIVRHGRLIAVAGER